MTLAETTIANARRLNLNMSAIADAAIQDAVRQAQREEWKQEHADALAAQDDWQDQHGHPFRAIMAGPFSGAGQS
ncbi:MAG: type II toxin-antitoxin system CcdA family antitoxin [Geminicoccaceae bacterium]|nr:type II toxin-antitoxin system CcdA family antitoxin [Geminicoccaceae bacterium]